MIFFFFFSSRRRHTRFDCDWSSDVCSSDLVKRFWTSANAGSAVVVIEVEPRLEQPQRFDLFQSALRARIPLSYGTVSIQSRSEERRVGKECRSRWSP